MLTPSEMKDRFRELAQKEGYIDSIINYCDRWCERCSFTSKCRNYASREDEPSHDGPELWDYLHNVFQATMLMLEETMEEMGIDREEINKMELPEETDPKDHQLYKRVHDLSFAMHDWLELNRPGELPLKESVYLTNVKEKDTRFRDAIEVVYFYNFLISAKIYRALIDTGDFTPDKIQNDSNGSAKVALISIDRLIAAWSVVMETMMDHQDEILKFLIGLAEIRKLTETTFPLARKFIRPGFDEQ